MAPPPIEVRPDRTGRLLLFVFVAVIGSFIATQRIGHRTSGEIDSLATEIVQTTTPSIERLVAVRTSVHAARRAFERHSAADGSAKAATAAAARSALETLRRDVDAYLSLPVVPDERRHWLALQREWSRFDENARHALAASEDLDGSRTEARLLANLQRGADRLLDVSARAIEFHAADGRALAAKIRDTRHAAIRMDDRLGALVVLLGTAGALLLLRSQRKRRELHLERMRLLEERAAELEHFSGRVAHDLRNPLTTAKLTMEMLRERSQDPRTAALVLRVERSLSRADAIISALLDFARAAARPDPGARTAVAETLTDLMEGFSADAHASHVRLHVAEPLPNAYVACSPGVYLSLVGNLVRNAIKYMGEATERRVTVRLSERDSRVRTEVIDTGPGIAPEHLPTLFEPYFRGKTHGQTGLGLGLATVKRLSEAHGGAVGVSSRPGYGSVFWFELPYAGASNHPPDRAAPSHLHPH